MAWLVRRRRAGEEERSRRRPGVHGVADPVPGAGQALELVDEDRRIAGQQAPGIRSCDLELVGVVELVDRSRSPLRGRALADALRALDGDRGQARQQLVQLGVDGAASVGDICDGVDPVTAFCVLLLRRYAEAQYDVVRQIATTLFDPGRTPGSVARCVPGGGDVRAADLRPVGPPIIAAIEAALHEEGLPGDALGSLDSTAVTLAKTASRSVLGFMNQMATDIEWQTARRVGLALADPAALNHYLQHTLRSRGDYAHPIELVRERLDGRDNGRRRPRVSQGSAPSL